MRNLLPYDGEAYYTQDFLVENEIEQLFHILEDGVHWKHDEIMLFGKKITTKRKVAFVGDDKISYKYSNSTKQSEPWSEELIKIKLKIEAFCKTTFNACLLNYYENGSQAMSWHSDNEKEIVANSSIASLSIGAARKFSFKHKATKETISIQLGNGSLLEMKGTIQSHWWHALPKSKKITTSRINLTFRQMHLKKD